jgi:hypothetical protein
MMPVEKIRRPDSRRVLGYRDSQNSKRAWGQLLTLPGLLGLFLVAGCATATITPTVRAPTGLPKPDRVLVHDFEIANVDSELSADLVPPTERGATGRARKEEDIVAGKAAAKVLAESLVEQLRSRGIDAQRASEAAPPGMNTLSIRGRFLWRHETNETMRARIWFYQGSGVNSRLVAQADADIPSDLKRESDAAVSTQQSDAKRMAGELAERIAGYYRKQGWIKS